MDSVGTKMFTAGNYLFRARQKYKLNANMIDMRRCFLRDTNVINPFKSNSQGKDYLEN
jgi:hypothetical protein